MASGRAFEEVTVCILHEDGSRTKKYTEPVTLILEYDPHGLSCKVRRGNTDLLDIPIDAKTECCRVGSKSYLFYSPHEDLLVTFTSESDSRRFHRIIYKMRQGKEASVFNERTDDSSATQYFQFYSYLSQQQNMMQDYIRTGTYQRAILSNMSDFKDKIILDVGAGSGILSFFAAQAGARKVYAVEASSMAQHCEMLVRANNLQDTIEVIAGKIEEIDLPDMVDMIISEPMGYMLYNERMLETYLHAKKWLKPCGRMFPSRGDLHVAPFNDETLYYEQLNKANFWYQNCFHGVDLCQLREQALNEYLRQPIVDTFDIGTCLAKSIRHSLDFLSAQEKDLHHLVIPLEFHILKSCTMHGLAFWFDVAFLGSTQTVWLSTAPTEPLTHWYQVRCLLEKPIFVKEGQLVTGTVELIANRRQSYNVKIVVRVEGTTTVSSNTLDLKNPYFRYTGVAPQPPPGNNTVSPSESYWQQMDALGAKEGQQVQLGSLSLGSHLNVPMQVGNYGRNHSSTQGNFSPSTQPSRQSTVGSSTAMGGGNFPVNSALMIGDYVTPGSIVLPTQGIQLGGHSSLSSSGGGGVRSPTH
ncbi:histone-arginine methyltransferase CARMER-like isoform X2 [Penaeus chinensis]|uniref:histone-arginine methyltransferase CARMER-like isoform X2 n=1 Tax=Penaeus chinensis TaxID=139456 RepID=UPI001FB69EDF|nr:histone-arginine methyltransferase CARMER-like isoform X2 [Penaeus chinensis]